MKSQAFHSKLQHPPTHKVTAGMSVNYLMEDCWSYLLTWRRFLLSENVWGCSRLAFWKLVELQEAIPFHSVSQSVICCLNAFKGKVLRCFSCISYPFDKVIEGQKSAHFTQNSFILQPFCSIKTFLRLSMAMGEKTRERVIAEIEEKTTTGRANEESLWERWKDKSWIPLIWSWDMALNGSQWADAKTLGPV